MERFEYYNKFFSYFNKMFCLEMDLRFLPYFLIPRTQSLIFLKMISSVLVTEIKYNAQKEER